jgi:hypothetical protein
MGFDLFYSHYPLKKGKGAARKKYESLKKKKILPDDEILIKAIQDQQKEKSYLRSQNKFVAEWKHPATWLNQECWDDECFLPSTPTPIARPVNSLGNMTRAFNIISNLGQNAFESYCKQINMPPEDREAVINKYQGKYDIQKLVRGIG